MRPIHQSTLNMALRCGEQFRRRYKMGEIVPPSIAAGRGTALHKANEVNLQNKIDKGEDRPLDELHDAARDAFIKTFKNGVFLTDNNKPEKAKLLNQGLNDALRCTSLYRSDVAPQIQPVAVEKEFKVTVRAGETDITLGGIIDYLDRRLRIGDLKTTINKWPAGRAQSEMQPVFYSLAVETQTGKRPDWDYHVLIARRGNKGNPTSEELQTIPLKVTNKQINALLAKCEFFMQMEQAGLYPPTNPVNWWCSPEWCGYHSTCPYVGNSLPTTWI